MKNSDWFSSWFNTPYYHILYKDRNESDAEFYMRKITEFLQLSEDAHILDLPCGKGRHAIYLSSLGYNVTGGDLSKNSIDYAKPFENENLHFKVKDMRKPFKNKYDAVFNLFTSFGYFQSDEDHILVLKNMKEGLRKNGVLVLDFMNAIKVEETLVKKEVKKVEGINFNIQREIVDGYILKHISFSDKGRDFNFTEKVQYLDLPKFQYYFSKVGLQLKHTFGNYQLEEFNKHTSDRLILVAS